MAAHHTMDTFSDPSFRDLMAQRPFLRLWAARLAGTSANQMLMVALGWQMYDLTGSAWDLGLIGLYQFIPALALTLWAGHVVDRHHRGRIVAFCLATQCVAALVLMAASRGQWTSRELLLGMSLVFGSVRVFQMAAQQALTPSLVPLNLLQRALAFSSAGAQVAIIGGPAVGGLVFVFGADKVYGLGAALLAISSALIVRLRYTHVPPPREPASLRTLLAGVAFIWRHKVILGAISLDLFAVLLGGAVALLPMFARDILHVGPQGLGLLRSAPAVGAVLVSVTLSRWPLRHHVGRTLLIAVAAFGICMVVFGLSTSFALSLLVLAISGGADMISVVVRQTLAQLETPNHMRGRVGAVNGVFIGASNQLGEFESGATAALLGPVGSVVAGGIGTIVVALSWRYLFPALATRDRLEVPAREP
ncbi:MAG: major facilitator superfamily 1 [Ramlibacter sp.]|nr:major facilitator superfamily 1 [Ramlibacter sp.]